MTLGPPGDPVLAVRPIGAYATSPGPGLRRVEGPARSRLPAAPAFGLRVTAGAVLLFALLLLSTLAPAQVKTPRDFSGDCSRSGCHDAFGKQKVVHSPVQQKSCDACHELTDEKKHKFKLTAEMPDVCTECHDDVTQDLKFQHGPLASGACTACHDPHASAHEKLLVSADNKLCLDCHEELGERLSESKLKHQPATESCRGCHRGHGGNNKMFLKTKVPELCTDCHDDIADLMEDAEVKHGAMTETNSCSLCHDPHASDKEHLLRRESMALCMSCHEKPVKTKDGKKVELAGLGDLLKNNPVRHGPIQQNDCLGCHGAVHGGDTRRLLSAAYPKEFYVPFKLEAYALCFKCHDSALVEEAESEETSFRNGEQNLHYLHVNKKTKGRRCSDCHDVHASKEPALIEESVPFGKGHWRLPIRFKQTKTGGSCAPGCHKPYRYDREQAVINVPRAKPPMPASPSKP